MPNALSAALALLPLLAAGAQEIDLSDPAEPWRTSNTGVSDQVSPPFGPVTLEGSTARVWGREVALAFPFPTAASSQGEALLAGPIRLVVRAGEREEILSAGAVEAESTAPRRATFRGSGGTLVPVSVDGWIEYDGLIRVNVALEPTAPVTLDRVAIEVPLNPAIARFYHGSSQWGKYLYGEVGETADWALSEGWQALWWVGDHARGLTVVTEQSRGWTGPRDEQIQLARRGDAVVLTLNWINEPTAIEEPRTITVGLQPTPGKPLPATWHGRHVGTGKIPATAEDARAFVEQQGCNVALLWYRDMVSFSYPQAADPATFRETVDNYHEAGVRSVTYITLSGTGNETPVFQRNRDEWVMTSDGKPLFQSAPETEDGYTSCCPASSYSDWLVWAVDQAMTAYDVDGVYIDNAGPYYCDNPAHGHEGRFYPYFANRDLQERLWQVVRGHKPEAGLVWEHNSRTSNSLNLTFCDIYSDGEHFRVKSRGDIEAITPEFLTITGTGRQWGSQPAFLPSALNRREGWTRWLLARLLPFGNPMMMQPSWLDFTSYAPALTARLDFGLDDTPVTWFTPEQRPEWLTVTPEAIAVGGYRRPDGALLLTLANWTDTHSEARLSIEPIAAQEGGPVVARDAFTDTVAVPLGKSWVFAVPANDYRMIVVEKGE